MLQQNPILGETVDWTNPITKGLVFASFPSAVNFNDIVTGGQGTIKANSSMTGMTPLGGGYRGYSNTTSGLYFFNGSTPNINYSHTLKQDFTILALANVRSADAWGGFLVIPVRSSGWSAPYITLQFCRNNATTQGHYGWSDGSSQYVIESGSNFFIANEGSQMYGLSRQGASVQFWKSGLRFGASQNTAGSNHGKSAEWREINLMSSGYNQLHSTIVGDLGVCAFWTRQLSPDEVMSFSLNPCQLIRQSLSIKARFYSISAAPTFRASWVNRPGSIIGGR